MSVKVTLKQIATRTEIPLRTLRYVVDNALVPTLKCQTKRGQVRKFTAAQARKIAIAAALMRFGFTADTVQYIMRKRRVGREVRIDDFVFVDTVLRSMRFNGLVIACAIRTSAPDA
jgi:DNA-binding transcriptional MerR regulator